MTKQAPLFLDPVQYALLKEGKVYIVIKKL